MTTIKEEKVPVFMPTKNRPRNIGKTFDDQASRLDGIAKVTGSAKYGKDVYPSGCLFAKLIRCPYGAGKLESYDVDAAAAVPGVLEVQVDGDHGKYHGQGVGHVLGESMGAVERAMIVLHAKWKVGADIKTKISDSVSEDSVRVSGKARVILDGAAHVLEAVYSTSVQTHCSAESHGAVVEHDGKRATVYASTQGTFSALEGVVGATGLSRSDVHVKCEYVGGGFGSKLQSGSGTVLAAKLSAKYKRPVHVFLDREEEHLDTGNRPGSRSVVRIGFDADGTILGGMIHTYGSVGIASGGGGVRFPSGRYQLGDIDKKHEDVRVNGGAPRPFRAPGSPQGAFAEELMLDEIATIAGVDPLLLRLKLERSDDRREMFKLGAEMIGWTGRAKTGMQTGTIRRGFGLGSTSWGRFPASSEIELVIHRDGSVEGRTGTQDIGTGQRTAMGVVAAHYLGVPLDLIHIRIGDSDLPSGPGSGGSMTLHNTEPAMREAAADARNKLLDLVAEEVGRSAEEFAIRDGDILRNGSRVMGFEDACKLIRGERITGRGTWNRQKRGSDPSEGHSEGVQFVDLRVDSETGVVKVDRIVAIQACGQVVCRKTAESQVMGAVIQGISYALFEDKILDRHTGAMVNANLEEYKVIGSRDVGRIEPVFYTKNQTGTRSLGEPPTIPTSGAIACAIYNAIGVPIRSLPMTPDKVLAAMEGGV